jgi:hypothetical protein
VAYKSCRLSPTYNAHLHIHAHNMEQRKNTTDDLPARLYRGPVQSEAA